MESLVSFIKIILACALFSVTLAKNIAFENCGGEVKSVNVDPCSTEPCQIPKGESVLITVNCLSNADAEKLRLTVWADLAGTEVPYPGMKRNACQGKNLTCPISKNQSITYTQKFEVKKFFPTVETKAKFILTTHDDRFQTICCFKAPVQVVEPAESA